MKTYIEFLLERYDTQNIDELKKRMMKCVDNEDYEEAAVIRDIIKKRESMKMLVGKVQNDEDDDIEIIDFEEFSKK